MLSRSTIKKKLEEKKPVIGTWNTLASPLVTEVMAQAGFDFQIIDLEHGPFVLDQVYAHVAACEGTGTCSPLVRIPANEEWMTLQALDQGAHGVVVPHVQDGDGAEKLASDLHYYPEGERGFTPFSKAGGFTNENVAEYVKTANREIIGVVLIESLASLENVAAIASQDGIDIVYFGAYDLSQELGHPGETRHPDVISAINRGVDEVHGTGKCPGGFVPQSKDDIKWLLDLGMGFITYEVDSSILLRHIEDVSGWFAEETGG